MSEWRGVPLPSAIRRHKRLEGRPGVHRGRRGEQARLRREAGAVRRARRDRARAHAGRRGGHALQRRARARLHIPRGRLRVEGGRQAGRRLPVGRLWAHIEGGGAAFHGEGGMLHRERAVGRPPPCRGARAFGQGVHAAARPVDVGRVRRGVGRVLEAVGRAVGRRVPHGRGERAALPHIHVGSPGRPEARPADRARGEQGGPRDRLQAGLREGPRRARRAAHVAARPVEAERREAARRARRRGARREAARRRRAPGLARARAGEAGLGRRRRRREDSRKLSERLAEGRGRLSSDWRSKALSRDLTRALEVASPATREIAAAAAECERARVEVKGYVSDAYRDGESLVRKAREEYLSRLDHTNETSLVRGLDRERGRDGESEREERGRAAAESPGRRDAPAVERDARFAHAQGRPGSPAHVRGADAASLLPEAPGGDDDGGAGPVSRRPRRKQRGYERDGAQRSRERR